MPETKVMKGTLASYSRLPKRVKRFIKAHEIKREMGPAGRIRIELPMWAYVDATNIIRGLRTGELKEDE